MDDGARRLDFAPSLRPLCRPDLEPLFWIPERQGQESAWWGHVPFAYWLMAASRPRVFVELGTHHAVSYAAFCQAVVRCGLDTRCYAVDTWQGDQHTMSYGDEVFAEVSRFHDERYAAFSTLLRCSFDQGLEHFAEGEIDLLHIDGYHTYEAVQHDFTSWRPKLSRRAVVLFHDINVRRDDFGAWQFWQELRENHPHFELHHAFGLGVLAVGEKIPKRVAKLCAINDREEGAALRSRLALLGERWVVEQHKREIEARERKYFQAHAQAMTAYKELEERFVADQAAFKSHLDEVDQYRRKLESRLQENERLHSEAQAKAQQRIAAFEARAVEAETVSVKWFHELEKARTEAATVAAQNIEWQRRFDDAILARIEAEKTSIKWFHELEKVKSSAEAEAAARQAAEAAARQVAEAAEAAARQAREAAARQAAEAAQAVAREVFERELQEWRSAYHRIAGSTAWKLTYPLRRAGDFVPPGLRRLLGGRGNGRG